VFCDVLQFGQGHFLFKFSWLPQNLVKSGRFFYFQSIDIFNVLPRMEGEGELVGNDDEKLRNDFGGKNKINI
jgi:hypothetical protein